MKKTLLLLLFPIVYNAQVMTDVSVFNNSNGSVFDVKNTNFKSYEGIDGSPYIDEAFSIIKIKGYNEVLPPVRYNAYEDEMEFKIDNQLNYVQKVPEMNFTFLNSAKKYALKNYTLEGITTNGWLVELVQEDGPFKLYKKERVQIVEYNNNTTNTYLKQKNPYFEKTKDLLILFDGHNYIKFPKNSKEFKLWVDNKGIDSALKSSEDYFRKNKINFSKDSDLVNLVMYMNTL
ncbi:hypothetical protein [Chryseobacterium salivictor]|uniref:GLPGLI family protein n=1 Tax=Chryseobacterium salivictor TaxID=2547600 RepID=A0A4P6ZDJ6_9FLAO|nr:hypothetical protein [Chryseobacterium salivictor]QBO57462.1 hypothetical protein NBC122_00626 [Chryseobacterium salivictor]